MPLYDRLWLAAIYTAGIGVWMPVYLAYLPYYMIAYRHMPEVMEEFERMSQAIVEGRNGKDVP